MWALSGTTGKSARPLAQSNYIRPMRSPVSRIAAIAAVLALGALCPVPAQAGDGPPPDTMCAVEGRTVVEGWGVATCRQFHESGAAVHLPEDSTRAVYGLWDGTGLLTRSGTLPVAGGRWETLSPISGLYLRATPRDGTATNPVPVLLVKPSAVLSPMAGLQARVGVQWFDPPPGVSDTTALLRFTSSTAAEVATYRHGLRVGARCIPALADTKTTRAAYEPFFGEGDLALLWFAGMHAPVDSEIVVDSQMGPSWMTRGPALIDLLSGPWQPTRVDFTIHANPIGTPAQMAGPLGPTRDRGRC